MRVLKPILSFLRARIQDYKPNKWYVIRQVLNRETETYSVWVNGKLKCENLPVLTTSGDSEAVSTYDIEAFSVSQCYNSVVGYFDDVKVFSKQLDFFVIPEVPLGAIIGLVGMFTALGTYYRFKKK